MDFRAFFLCDVNVVFVLSHRYILPYSPVLPETGAYRPVSSYPVTNSLRGGSGVLGIDEQEGHLAWHKAMLEAKDNVPV